MRRYRELLHRGTIDLAFDFEFALAVEWLQRAQLADDSRRIFHLGDTHIKHRAAFRRNDIGSRPSLDGSNVEREPVLHVGQFGDGDDLFCEFYNRAFAFFEIQPGMCRFASDFQRVFADALARSFYRAF